jgi:hypothetical protein
MAPDGMRCNQQGESHLFAALMTTGKLLSGDASHVVIVVMAAVTNLIDS